MPAQCLQTVSQTLAVSRHGSVSTDYLERQRFRREYLLRQAESGACDSEADRVADPEAQLFRQALSDDSLAGVLEHAALGYEIPQLLVLTADGPRRQFLGMPVRVT